VFVQRIGKIHGDPNLNSDTRARDILAAKDAKIKSYTPPDKVLAAGQNLELTLTQVSIVCISAVNLSAQGQPSREVV